MRNLLLLVAVVVFVLTALNVGAPPAPGGAFVDADNPPPLKPGVEAVSFERLAAFAYNDRIPREGGNIPQSVRTLDGRRVRLLGHLMATRTSDEGKVLSFALSRTSPECCYGRMPRINEWVLVDASAIDVPNRRAKVWVSGTLEVGEVKSSQGHVLAIYQMRAEAVE